MSETTTPDPIEEAVAQAICNAWGYSWDGDPEDEQTAPEVASDGDTRPDKILYREAARQAIAAYHAAMAEAERLKQLKEKTSYYRRIVADDMRRILTNGR